MPFYSFLRNFFVGWRPFSVKRRSASAYIRAFCAFCGHFFTQRKFEMVTATFQIVATKLKMLSATLTVLRATFKMLGGTIETITTTFEIVRRLSGIAVR